MNWYLAVLKKYAVFNGRARRKEYWMFFLFNLIIGFILGFVEGLVHKGFGILGAVYSLLVFLPGLGVAIRRLHDTGRSGWWLLLGLIPLLGMIVLLIFMLIGSDPAENNYGPNPKL
jgi:uncharacterized membrane protein YhaH (DUF805 family)